MSEILQRLPEFVGNHLYLSMAFVGLLVAAIASEVSRLLRGYKELTPAGLTALINRENALVIDVSSIAEYEKGHIPGAKHVAMSQFDPENKELAKVRDLPVAIYCRTGQTSADAAKRLVRAGFKKVYWLGSGVGSWTQADLPLAKGQK